MRSKAEPLGSEPARPSKVTPYRCHGKSRMYDTSFYFASFDLSASSIPPKPSPPQYIPFGTITTHYMAFKCFWNNHHLYAIYLCKTPHTYFNHYWTNYHYNHYNYLWSQNCYTTKFTLPNLKYQYHFWNYSFYLSTFGNRISFFWLYIFHTHFNDPNHSISPCLLKDTPTPPTPSPNESLMNLSLTNSWNE